MKGNDEPCRAGSRGGGSYEPSEAKVGVVMGAVMTM